MIHVVVEKAITKCIAVIGALVKGTHIVAFAWLSSVQHTVKKACKLIMDAPNNESALSVSRLADEAQSVSKFSEADNRIFGAAVLDNAFVSSTRARRSHFF